MRNIEYLSPSSIGVFEQDVEEFYLRYLADERPPRFPQTQAMSIGSGFDAYVKNYIHDCLFGKGFDPKYDLDALFDAQVEEHNWDWTKQHAPYVFEQYKQTGAIADLMLELRRAQSEVRFEFEVRGAVSGYREGIETKIANVTLLGKPDMHFVNHEGVTVILDFKVNGYCSQRAVSPMAGYLQLRQAGRTAMGSHKNAIPMLWNGMMVNINSHLEDHDPKWGRQLAIYAWLTGCPVGSEFIVGIDQLACSPNPGGLPGIKVAQHRTRVSNSFQWLTFNRASEIWETVHSDHIFRNMSKQLSQDHCSVLDQRSKELRGECAPHDKWFAETTRVVKSW